jgi:hypothetical protein
VHWDVHNFSPTSNEDDSKEDDSNAVSDFEPSHSVAILKLRKDGNAELHNIDNSLPLCSCRYSSPRSRPLCSIFPGRKKSKKEHPKYKTFQIPRHLLDLDGAVVCGRSMGEG